MLWLIFDGYPIYHISIAECVYVVEKLMDDLLLILLSTQKQPGCKKGAALFKMTSMK